jgi:hypothetical protein
MLRFHYPFSRPGFRQVLDNLLQEVYWIEALTIIQRGRDGHRHRSDLTLWVAVGHLRGISSLFGSLTRLSMEEGTDGRGAHRPAVAVGSAGEDIWCQLLPIPTLGVRAQQPLGAAAVPSPRLAHIAAGEPTRQRIASDLAAFQEFIDDR